MRRVAITGIGLLSALGAGVQPSWQQLIRGKSAVGPIKSFDASALHSQLGAELLDFDPLQYVTNKRSVRMMTRNDQLSVAGAVLAVADSGANAAEWDPERVGLFVGSNKEISNPSSLLDGTLVARNDDGSVDWHRLVTQELNVYEPGVFDVRAAKPRATALAGLYKTLGEGQLPSHPLLEVDGWWHRPERLIYNISVSDSGMVIPAEGPQVVTARRDWATVSPLLITGASGTLGRALGSEPTRT